MKPAVDKLGRLVLPGHFICYATTNGSLGVYKVFKVNHGNPSWPSLSCHEYVRAEAGGPFYQAREKTTCLRYPGQAVIIPDGYADIRNEMLPRKR